jgi:hypothetical protein
MTSAPLTGVLAMIALGGFIGLYLAFALVTP